MLKITNISGRSLDIAGTKVKANETVYLDISYETVRNLERNRFILVQEVEDFYNEPPYFPDFIEDSEPIDIIEEEETKAKKVTRRKRNKK